MQHMPVELFFTSLAILVWLVDSWVFDFPAAVYIGNQDGVSILVIGSQVAAIKVGLGARDAAMVRHMTLTQLSIWLLVWSTAKTLIISVTSELCQDTFVQLDPEPVEPWYGRR